MNGDVHRNELPEVKDDDDVKLLCRICQDADDLDEAQVHPFRALFAKYEETYAKENRNPDRDDLLFRYIMRIGEAANRTKVAGGEVDLVGSLKELLAAHGVTLIDGIEDGFEELTRSIEVPPESNERRHRQRPHRRRVSFDDARLEEMWLSEHSRSLTVPVHALPNGGGLLSRAPIRGRAKGLERRARSTSSERGAPLRQAAPKHFQHASLSSAYQTEPDGPTDPTMRFQLSLTQLGQNAEAFRATSDLRSARRCLHRWYNGAIVDRQQHIQAYAIAYAHDRRMLQKSGLDFLRDALREKQNERRIEAHFSRWEFNVARAYNHKIVYKAFTHWAVYCGDQKIQTAVAHRHILRIRYFNRWRAIAVENAIKARSILGWKYAAIWRDRTTRKLLVRERAMAHYEEAVLKRSYLSWRWQVRERRVTGWQAETVKRKTFGQWLGYNDQLHSHEQRATHHRIHRNTARYFHSLADRTRYLWLTCSTATTHHDRRILQYSFATLAVHAKLAPLAATITGKVRFNLQRKALLVWQMRFTLSRQAAEVDRKRILHNVCREWNDNLRCRALGQRLDERVVVEHLCKWVLEERLRLFCRTTDDRLKLDLLHIWHNRSSKQLSALERAEQAFAQSWRRRKLATAMVCFNTTLRQREDAERAAFEFANSRTLPNVLGAWSQQTTQVVKLAKWAADARFYTLTSSTLRIWKERTTEHRHTRRREAYVQVRARVKVRIVGKCFMQWQTNCMEVHSMNGEAERRAQTRLFSVGTQTFDRWRAKAFRLHELQSQATEQNTRKLLSSAFSAMIQRHQDLETLTQQASTFRQEANLATLATALKRLQWSTFTAARSAESAEALWARNRDQHIRHMLRHWSSQSAARQTAKTPQQTREERDPESPSLRPASRVAARSVSRDQGMLASLPSQQQQQTAAAPGYMQTPSRSRRVGRFRPLVLPTPGMVTPMVFDAGYFAKTPAPFGLAMAVAGSSPVRGLKESEGLAMQVTPFARKLRAGGIVATAGRAPGVVPLSALKVGALDRSVRDGAWTRTGKSVRFAGAGRFARSSRLGEGSDYGGGHLKGS